MRTALRLSTHTATRTAPITGTSPARSRARQNFGGLNQAYRALTMTQKGTWQAAANTLNATQGRVGIHRLHPANAYVALNSARLATGQPALTAAPATLLAPPLLPLVTVQSSAPATANAPFTLTLASPVPYACPVQILAAPPTPAGKTTFPDKDFKPLGHLPGLPADTPVSIAAIYQAAHGTPEIGSQISLKLIAVSPAGLRLTPLVLTAVVTLPSPSEPSHGGKALRGEARIRQGGGPPTPPNKPPAAQQENETRAANPPPRPAGRPRRSPGTKENDVNRTHCSTLGLCLALIAALPAAASAQTPTVAAPYRARLTVEPPTLLPAHPTQMAWGPDRRLYVMTTDGGVLSYAYNRATGAVTDPKSAVPNAQGVGIAFYRRAMYITTYPGPGAIRKLTDSNGNGVWGETAAGELDVPIVTGIPTGDHPVDQLQVQGRSLYVGIGRRTINGRKGPLTSGSQEDFGGQGFWYGGDGSTWGDCAYGGTISWIRNLDAVPDAPGAANVYAPPVAITQSLIQQDASPFQTRDEGKLVVHSAGARNPFGLCFDLFGSLWFTNNFNRTATMGNGQSGFGYPEDTPGPDFSRDVQDQVFHASPGADYGYADDNWRGKNPMLTPGTRGYHRVLSTTFDNLFNNGPYTLHDPAHPDGLGPSSSSDGCGFWYSWDLPFDLWGDIFITRWNNAITEAPNGGTQHTLSYSDLVAVNTRTGKVSRVASGFGQPIAVLWDRGDRLLLADYSSPANGGGGALYALRAGHPGKQQK